MFPKTSSISVLAMGPPTYDLSFVIFGGGVRTVLILIWVKRKCTHVYINIVIPTFVRFAGLQQQCHNQER